MADKIINIKFPFKDSLSGLFFDVNKTTTDAIKSNILHVLLTQKGQRMYNPRFGTNLYQYLFEPNDSITLDDIKNEANVSLTYSFPNVQITKLDAVANEQTVLLSITANNTADLLNSTIFMEVLI